MEIFSHLASFEHVHIAQLALNREHSRGWWEWRGQQKSRPDDGTRWNSRDFSDHPQKSMNVCHSAHLPTVQKWRVIRLQFRRTVSSSAGVTWLASWKCLELLPAASLIIVKVWKRHRAIQIEESPGNLLLQDTVYSKQEPGEVKHQQFTHGMQLCAPDK